jgi:hypothetical protein
MVERFRQEKKEDFTLHLTPLCKSIKETRFLAAVMLGLREKCRGMSGVKSSKLLGF